MNRVMVCPIQAAAQKYPDRIALYDINQTLTFSQLDAMVTGTAAALQARGVVPGQVVSILGRNTVEFAIVFFAALRHGFILMPLNYRLTPADRRRQLSAADCRLAIHDSEFKAEAADLGVTSVSIREIISDDVQGSSHSSVIEIPLEREALVIFSSGSTGRPRGVVLTWGNLYFNALGSATFLPLGPEDIWLAVLPFFHIGGISILFRTALAACGAYVMPRFEAKGVIDVLRQNHISLISLVPTMLNDLLGEDGDNLLRGVRGIILGGAAFDAALRQTAAAKRLPVLTTYGMTETTSMVTLLDKSDRPDLWATAGRILPYREVLIADDKGKSLPMGERGHIMIRGDVVSRRYIGERGTERLPDDWFDTGDIGIMDAPGYLTVVGRQDSIIISGGENIDLTRIETVLNAISGVKGAVVVSRKDEKWGRRPVAFVEPSGADFPEERIMGEMAAQLPRFMLPDRIIIVRPLPLTAGGKYDRIALQEQYPDVFK
ncbi:MAG: o-succinylbenzoate--CoA ligase [candidate division Zixibacteria bacterium]|nr:o-succinylbenzoate--CoA ligase [candidate division Zixibacteria bacterium]